MKVTYTNNNFELLDRIIHFTVKPNQLDGFCYLPIVCLSSTQSLHIQIQLIEDALNKSFTENNVVQMNK